MEHWYEPIEGWFDFQELYDRQVGIATSPAKFVEVGCWKGRSTAYLACNIINSGKDIKLDAVDTWEGSYEHRDDSSVVNDTLYQEFLTNLIPADGVVTAIRKPSVDAASMYDDESLDFVFIDANHEYDAVMADITAWLPKVKVNGYIGGHDYHIAPGVSAAASQLCPGHNTDGNSWIFCKR